MSYRKYFDSLAPVAQLVEIVGWVFVTYGAALTVCLYMYGH